MEYHIRSFAPGEAPLFYSDSGKDKQADCIGFLRGDFGREGRAFWTSWWERTAHLKTQEFQTEFDDFINALRDDSLLKDRSSMARYCARYPEARIPGAWHADVYGFCVETDHHRYFLRCFPHFGDYNFFIFCYRRDGREQTKGNPDRPQIPAKKRHTPER